MKDSHFESINGRPSQHEALEAVVIIVEEDTRSGCLTFICRGLRCGE